MFYPTAGPKIPLRSVIKANVDVTAKLPEKLTAVVVGGTGGIGEAATYKFATYVKSPTIYILGRNEKSAERVISNLKKINGSATSKYEFIKTDVSLLESDDAAVKQIMAKEDKINSLIITAGILWSSERKETPEGLDAKMATNYYGRWHIVSELLPSITRAAEANEPTTVISVLGPDAERLAVPDDIELKNHYTRSNVRSHNCSMNSFAADHFAKLYPKTAFVHLSPGLVNTNIGQTLPWYVRYAANGFLKVAAQPPDNIAEKMAYISLANNELLPKGSAWLLDQHLRKITHNLDQIEEERLWNHTQAIYDRILK